ncbi:MAG: amidohydrolase family protein [Deltaproteobacteria bacterium]|nr:amidohydrolase family protein [Deltaproteobacteria bacterium]
MKTRSGICFLFLFLSVLLLGLLSGCFHSSKLPPLIEKYNPGKPIIIKGAAVFTGIPGQDVLRNADILIENGKIARIGDVSDAKSDCLVIDGKGKMVIPGLIDHHVHITSPGTPPWYPVMPDRKLIERNLSAFVYAGITSVFDMGGPPYDMESTGKRIAAEDKINPRLFYVGKILTKKGGHPCYMLDNLMPWPGGAIAIRKVVDQISDKDDIRPAILENKAHGATMTKIVIDQLPLGIPSLYEDLTREIVAQSKKEGLTLCAHIGSESDILTGMNAGVRFFAHAPYRSSLSDATIQRMKADQVSVISTLVVFDRTADFFKNTTAFTGMDRQILDPQIMNAYLNPPNGALDFGDPRLVSWVHDLETCREIKFENVRRMKAAGITIIAGTDSPNVATVAGSSLHTELRLLVEKCGFSPTEAVLAATSVSGEMIEKITGVKGLGRITPGGPADLVILNKDFRNDITQTENINTVISNGRIVKRQEL